MRTSRKEFSEAALDALKQINKKDHSHHFKHSNRRILFPLSPFFSSLSFCVGGIASTSDTGSSGSAKIRFSNPVSDCNDPSSSDDHAPFAAGVSGCDEDPSDGIESCFGSSDPSGGVGSNLFEESSES